MKKTFKSQEDLIKHLKKGDEIAYTYLVKLYYDKLCDYASNLARDDFKSEDIVQNVIVKMWKHCENLKPYISIKNYGSSLNQLLFVHLCYEFTSNKT